MNLNELKQAVDAAVESANEYGQSPDEVVVSLQIELLDSEDAFFTDDSVELHYDNDCQASGCVLLGFV